MSERFFVKYGDTAEPIMYFIKRKSKHVDLTGCIVRIIMTDWNEKEVVVDDIVNIVDAKGGLVSYTFKDFNVVKPKAYKAEIEVDFPDFKQETFPENSQIIVSIIDTLRNKAEIASVDGGGFGEGSDDVLDGGDF